jgi:hypothetical protein
LRCERLAIPMRSLLPTLVYGEPSYNKGPAPI